MTHGFLSDLYQQLAQPVLRGRPYPAAIETAFGGSVQEAVSISAQPVEIDGRLRLAGQAHLDAVIERTPGLHDGAVLVLSELRGGVAVAASASYFQTIATCDSLRAEAERVRDPRLLEDLPLRAAAHLAAGDDPLRSGRGRAAAIGVTTLVTLPKSNGRAFLLGRRNEAVASDPGKWDIAPSGMLEPEPVGEMVARELREETGLAPGRLDDRLRVLGWGFDLLRLRPELCLRLDLEPDEAPLIGLSPEEFDQLRLIGLSDEGLADFWRSFGPDELTPSAAAAVALAEADGDTRGAADPGLQPAR